MPRESGASSTPRPLRSSTTVSGILDRSVEPSDDSALRGGDAALCDDDDAAPQ
ncbi:ABC transporter HlyB/MsbA family [Bradyrhizobium elkanii USDA 61]|nr:ABC transporter HlyB/MsbA family [Bradyrhizobium elkanii USDA 61]